MSYPWKKEEIEKLEEMIKQNHTKTEIARAMGRTVTAIQIKANKMGLQILNTSDNVGNRGRAWKQKDVELLKNLWYDATVSKAVMEKRLHRTWVSIRKKALELKLGPREYDTEYLSIPTICEEMQVSHDRVSHWIKLGLKKKKNRSGKVKYLIDVDDLLEFLEQHQSMFNASVVSEYLFYDEPEWFVNKRKKDAEGYAIKNGLKYTNEEDRKIIRLFELGKSDLEIAKELDRTEIGIKYHRITLGLCHNQYSFKEIEILQRYSDTKTVDELCEMLPMRTRKGIMYKCEKMGLPYHISKERCKNT